MPLTLNNILCYSPPSLTFIHRTGETSRSTESNDIAETNSDRKNDSSSIKTVELEVSSKQEKANVKRETTEAERSAAASTESTSSQNAFVTMPEETNESLKGDKKIATPATLPSGNNDDHTANKQPQSEIADSSGLYQEQGREKATTDNASTASSSTTTTTKSDRTSQQKVNKDCSTTTNETSADHDLDQATAFNDTSTPSVPSKSTLESPNTISSPSAAAASINKQNTSSTTTKGNFTEICT